MPGERLDQTKLEKFEKRLQNTGYFGTPGQPNSKPPKAQVMNERPWNTPFGSDIVPGLGDLSGARMQNPADDAPPGPPPLGPDACRRSTCRPPPRRPAAPRPWRRSAATRAVGSAPTPDTLPPALPGEKRDATPPGQVDRPGHIGPFRDGGMNYENRPPSPGPAGSIYDPSNPTGTSPGFLNNNINQDIGPDRQEPFIANKAYADVMASVDEAPTSRLDARRRGQQLRRALRQPQLHREQLQHPRHPPDRSTTSPRAAPSAAPGSSSASTSRRAR